MYECVSGTFGPVQCERVLGDGGGAGHAGRQQELGGLGLSAGDHQEGKQLPAQMQPRVWRAQAQSGVAQHPHRLLQNWQPGGGGEEDMKLMNINGSVNPK